MTQTVQDLIEIATDPGLGADDRARALRAAPVPGTMRAITLHRCDQDLFAGVPESDRDPRKSVHEDEVPVPELGTQEVLVAPMAASVNYNNVWSAMFVPASPFDYLRRLARVIPGADRDDLPYQVIGSDAAGVVVRTGPGVTRWRPGDRVLVHPGVFVSDHPKIHHDAVADPMQRAWGFETNFGAFAELTRVRETQLLPMPGHLTWAEAASLPLALGTSYRMLIGDNGAAMRPGEVVLIWGAAGGIGGYAVQLVRHGGGIPVCVVGSAAKVDRLRALGVEYIIDREAEDYRFWSDGVQRPEEWRRLGQQIRRLTGGHDADIVFEHTGRETFGASVFVARRGGRIVTCASTTGPLHEFDNRHLWMHAKRIIGSHGANYYEMARAHDLVGLGAIHPMLSKVYPLAQVGSAIHDMWTNQHTGKLGILVNAAGPDDGVLDPEARRRHSAGLQLWGNRR